MMHEAPQLSNRELEALARGREKAALVAWLRREAASRNGPMAWYVARAIGPADIAAAELRAAGIEAICPMERRWKRYPRAAGSNRRYSVDIPLYGQDFLVRLLAAESAWVGVISFERVACLLGNGERPVQLTEGEVERVMAQLGNGVAEPVREVAGLDVGDSVVHPLGTFAELVGRVVEVDAERRQVLVATVLFGREIETRCGIDDLERL